MNSEIVAFNSKYAPEIIRIRTTVFVEEQGIDRDIDFDGLDQKAVHVLVRKNGQSIATARILDDGHIGRIAVLKDFRRQGVGACALKALMDVARKREHEKVFLGSQAHATGFYLKMGFHVCGEPFLEAGIEHVKMACSL